MCGAIETASGMVVIHGALSVLAHLARDSFQTLHILELFASDLHISESLLVLCKADTVDIEGGLYRSHKLSRRPRLEEFQLGYW
jgi:hypothetical protein